MDSLGGRVLLFPSLHNCFAIVHDRCLCVQSGCEFEDIYERRYDKMDKELRFHTASDKTGRQRELHFHMASVKKYE